MTAKKADVKQAVSQPTTTATTTKPEPTPAPNKQQMKLDELKKAWADNELAHRAGKDGQDVSSKESRSS